MSTTMNGRDAVSGSMGRCFVTIEGNRYLLMQVISVKAEMKGREVQNCITTLLFLGNFYLSIRIQEKIYILTCSL